MQMGIGHAIITGQRIMNGICFANASRATRATFEAKEYFVFIQIFPGCAAKDRPADGMGRAWITALNLNGSPLFTSQQEQGRSSASGVLGPTSIALNGRTIRSGLDESTEPPGNKNCGTGISGPAVHFGKVCYRLWQGEVILETLQQVTGRANFKGQINPVAFF